MVGHREGLNRERVKVGGEGPVIIARAEGLALGTMASGQYGRSGFNCVRGRFQPSTTVLRSSASLREHLDLKRQPGKLRAKTSRIIVSDVPMLIPRLKLIYVFDWCTLHFLNPLSVI